ncbi:similar to Saccharomyces cerevisiae YDR295C HDA2 Subunit of a possibly tetrameric trichostatin A-sensitive class II histone deacetylase complex containing an Hda1p homodimer and an Hda2p-Hda3p heterodimer [Maudiozyma barnettii]|uniref:HDA1 complex subunit 2 n=1 Tax=Maudiozyma barnettii TaxID=61262 RepID=A0A8H2ZIH4_9SACH|nr:Hda2p [Kazachstania barnettii]CAB4254958.1 similar to Saccharomyces cerevisiae YDR295C HDA2 Subunit of a possibly tetrameric trichostatin A-sensitive class II histone deacetylase complex containing an Hda1p homodimer and an Hda2p-Hda3p heterodimer [Kazachstania barnettii]CAD1783229.1 similar to Saccharomyces cerevisiae YDR295C HDA2 Subunit of a possibly tetrameric trichostatin A-sensitive class II histone deacetylase complex containing an Hda1p homodimer and an Hda2p-Hda3p heterodimer [Kazachs
MNVNYLPVGLTNFQKDLIEILVSIHAISFRNELNGVKHEPTMSDNGYPSLSSRQLTYMFNTHVRAVANHPCLLVDHYMPRQFLRMEPTERLINSSDKFRILQTLLHCLSTLCNPENGELLKIAIISHSIKELDLLESIVLGKQFKLKRLSGTALYAEGTDFKRDMQLHGREMSSMKNVSNSGEAKSMAVRSTSPSTSSANISPVESAEEHGSRGSTPVTTTSNNTHANTVSSGWASTSTTNGGSNASSSGSSSSGPIGTSYTGYPKDDYDYSIKHNRKRQKVDNRNWLFLTTSTHLAHEQTLLDEYSLDLIISFDPLLDPTLLAIKNINKSHFQYSTTKVTQRMKNKYKVPIVKLLVRDSPDHYLLQNNLNLEHDAAKEYDNIKNAMYHFLQCRRSQQDGINDTTTKDNAYYTEFLQNILSASMDSKENRSNNTNNDVIPLSQLTTTEDSAKSFIPKFVNSVYPNSEITCCEDPFSIKSYQTTLMQKTIARLDAINGRLNENELHINDLRLKETERQGLIDSLKAEIGTIFKSKQDLEKVKLDSEKRFERTNNESIKLNEKMSNIQKYQDELESLTKQGDSTSLQETLNQLSHVISTHQATLKTLVETNEKQALENDEHRATYQRDSSRAAAQSTELATLKKTVDTLKKEQEGTVGLSMNLLGAERMETHLIGELDLARRRNEFLERYITKMTKDYKLHLHNNDNKVSTPMNETVKGGNGSSNTNHDSATSTKSNTPNGTDEYSRHRSTRSAAPSYT